MNASLKKYYKTAQLQALLKDILRMKIFDKLQLVTGQ